MSGSHGLVPSEGVDEGSAASAVEGPHGPEGDAVLGAPPHGRPGGESDPAGPVDAESAEARTARAERAPGQQLQEGEG